MDAYGEDNGFGLKLSVGFPRGTYSQTTSFNLLGVQSSTTSEYEQDATSFGLTLENRLYVCPQEKWGVAVHARWIDMNYAAGDMKVKSLSTSASYGETSASEDLDLSGDYTMDMKNAEIGFLGVGPMFTYYLGNDMAIDVFYNLVPTFMYSNLKPKEASIAGFDVDLTGDDDIWDWDWDEDDDTSSSSDDDSEKNYIGVGITHNIGAAFRYKFLQAGVEYRLGKMEIAEVDDDADTFDYKTNCFKIFVGFKF